MIPLGLIMISPVRAMERPLMADRTQDLAGPRRPAAAQPVARRHAAAGRAGHRARVMWYFMRISGLLLVILAMGHMLIMHVLVQLTGEEINFAFVTSRWGTPFWRIYDLLLLVAGPRPRGERRADHHRRLHRARRPAQPADRDPAGCSPSSGCCSGIFVIVTFDPNGAAGHRALLVSLVRQRRGGRAAVRGRMTWTRSWSAPAAPACTRRWS